MYPISASPPLAYSIKTLRESSKIFVEQALHVLGYSFKPRPNSRALVTAVLSINIGLSIDGYSHSKTQFDERKQIY